ncbi:MAG: SurA N-terminal domain-containing protein [Nitrospirota bacterium]|nr:SurA N-terminal domain-containing protein [Nitrospirota bacterium]
MLEMIRRFGVEKKWVFGLVLGIVTVTFVGTMGWMGMSAPSGVYAAKVNGDEILVTDLDRAYKNLYQRYADAYGKEWNDDLAKQIGLRRQALEQLVDSRLWRKRAQEMGLAASDAEVRDAVMREEAFQVNGRFNTNRYRDLLQRVRLTPEAFEASVRNSILEAKARQLSMSAADASAVDIQVFKLPDDAKLGAEELAAQQAQRRQALQRRKGDQLQAAITEHLKQESDLKIYAEAAGLVENKPASPAAPSSDTPAP